MVTAMERVELLAEVASKYYDDDLTQDEIGRQLSISRSTVSRLLQQAREAGVVEITVHHPWVGNDDLEKRLVSVFGLRKAIVLSSGDRSANELRRGVGQLASRYLQSVLADGINIAISWGSAVYHTVGGLRPEPFPNITVTQLVGAVGEGDPSIDGPELVRSLAECVGGGFRYLHAPLIARDAHAREIMLQQPHISATLALARQADIALVGIGAPTIEANSLLRAGYVDERALAELRSAGAVGDICARHYDVFGSVLDLELNQRVIGVELRSLAEIDCVIGVTSGKARASAVLGALRGKHVDVLVTDDGTAEQTLALLREES